MRKLRQFFVYATANATIVFVSLIPVTPAYAHHCFGHVGEGEVSIAECADAGACLDTGGANCANQETAEVRVNRIIKLVINILSLIVGVVAVIMIIISGLKYITSGGDTNNVTSAKNTILYAIIGLIIVALAQVIVRFVLDKAADTPAVFLYLIG